MEATFKSLFAATEGLSKGKLYPSLVFHLSLVISAVNAFPSCTSETELNLNPLDFELREVTLSLDFPESI